MHRTCLLGAECVDQTNGKRVLMILESIRVLQEKRNIGIVVPVFKASNDAVFVFEFSGDREFFQLLRLSARESLLILVVLPPRREREPTVRLDSAVCSDSLPSNHRAAFLIRAVIIITGKAQLGAYVKGCNRVGPISPCILPQS